MRVRPFRAYLRQAGHRRAERVSDLANASTGALLFVECLPDRDG